MTIMTGAVKAPFSYQLVILPCSLTYSIKGVIIPLMGNFWLSDALPGYDDWL